MNTKAPLHCLEQFKNPTKILWITSIKFFPAIPVQNYGLPVSWFGSFFLWWSDTAVQLKQSRFFHEFSTHWQAYWKGKQNNKLLLSDIFHHCLLYQYLWIRVTRENWVQCILQQSSTESDEALAQWELPVMHFSVLVPFDWINLNFSLQESINYLI